MQLQLSFSALLAGFVLVLSLQVLDAAPIPKRSSVSMVTLPLKRMEQARNVHPLIVCVLIKSTLHGTYPRLCSFSNNTSTVAIVVSLA